MPHPTSVPSPRTLTLMVSSRENLPKSSHFIAFVHIVQQKYLWAALECRMMGKIPTRDVVPKRYLQTEIAMRGIPEDLFSEDK